MHALILFLQLLNLLETVLKLYWLLIALEHHTLRTLYQLFITTHTSLSASIPIFRPTHPIPGPTQQTILYHPSIPMHNLCYIVITRSLAALPLPTRTLFTPYMRGRPFALLANSLIANDPAPILAAHGIKLAPPEQRKVAYLATLPELVVTAPEDGDRRAERGERGGGKVRVFEGLVPPRKVQRLGKKKKEEESAREKRREEEGIRGYGRDVTARERKELS